MSKLTARAHQAHYLPLSLTADHLRILGILRRRWYQRPATAEEIVPFILNLALIHWRRLEPAIQAEALWMAAEGVTGLAELHRRKLRATKP